MRAFWASVLALAFTTVALGQAARTATLVGNVTDPTGALVPGAKVTVKNVATGFVSTGVTNAEGAYYIPFLAVGEYELTVEAAGFKTYVQKGLELRAGEVPRVDVKLEIGATTESIMVTGAAPLLQTETSQVTHALMASTIRQLPILQNKAHRLPYYMAGVQVSGANISVVGQPPSELGFTLDGISGKTAITNQIGDTNTSVQPALEALAEARLYTTGAPAEMGHSSGGVLAFTFKSGTNEFHGSFEDRWTNQPMTHRGYLEQGKRSSPLTFHQGQATISGPVILPKLYDGRNKTFFLFAYGRHHEKSDEPQTATVPDLSMLNGDFSFPQVSGGGYPIYDPKSMRLVGSTWTADPFPNKQIPKSQFDSVAVNFLALNPWAPPNLLGSYTRSGPSNNWLGTTIYRSYRSRFDTKFDHQVNPNHKFFIRNSWNRHRQLGRINAYVNNRELDSASFSFGRPNPIDQQNWAFADYHTFSPTLMNEIRLGFGRRISTIDPPTVGKGWAAKLGIPNVGPENFPSFGLYGIGPGSYQRNINEEVTFQNNTTKILSRHTLKFGYELIRTRQNNVDAVLPSGSYSFGTGGTALPFTPNTGNTFASFLTGAVSSATFTQRIWSRLPRWWSHGAYIQTDWRATRALTLNLGLRYTVETPFRDKWDHQSVFNPTVTDPLTGLMGAITHPKGGTYKTDRNNFQPRVGMAWNFRRGMVFRGSWGMFTDDVMPSAGFQEYTATAVAQQLPGDPRPAFFLSQGPPARDFRFNPDGTSPFLGTNYSGRSAQFIDSNFQLPYVMNWSAGVQVEFKSTWLVEGLYQGSSGVRLNTSANFNQLSKSIYDSTDLAYKDQVSRAVQNYRPYTQFGTISYITNGGHNSYHGFTARVEKRYAEDGLTLNAHYTWSKNLSGGVGDGWQYYNWRLTKAPTSFDRRHRIIVQAMYDIPVGKGRKFLSGGGWLDHALGGWTILIVETLQSGPPVTFSFSGSPYRYLPGPSRPNQILPSDQVKVKDWSMGEHRFPQSAQNPLFNINAFKYPDALTAGTLGAGTARGLWMIWPQWSISKGWDIREKMKFTLRCEAINIPVRFMGTIPNVTVNLTSPQNFGKFAPQTSSSYSTMGSLNGQLFIMGRFEF